MARRSTTSGARWARDSPRHWGAPNAARLETIFRTNVQAAYNAGRFAELSRPAMRAVRPFWKYVAILDGRTTATCAPLQGTVRRHDDDFRRTHWPPLHFNCRSTVVSLSCAEAARAGGAGELPKAKPPGEGFGTRPDLAGEALRPTEKALEATKRALVDRDAPAMSKGGAIAQQLDAVTAQDGVDDAYVRNTRVAQWLARRSIPVDPISDDLVDVIDIDGKVVGKEAATVDPWVPPPRIRLSRWIGTYGEIPAETRGEPSSFAEQPRGAFVDSWARTPRDTIARIATHEFAHALEADLVHRGGNDWSVSLQSERNYYSAMQETRPGRGPVSAYARKNPQEYFAESVTAYLHTPDILRARDPDQYETIEYILRREGIIP
ncbi:MAG: minor capsid protein [Myxococcales bacterium]|nr:minor capsid protein [Myxococcales bacterium]